ncbi:MAG: NUDIX hydrolase [Candidatus Latescibacterota bacterium]
MKDLPLQRAASVIIYDSNDRILLAKQSSSKSFDPGLWETIGGKIEPGEAPLQALFREVSEELGNEAILKDIEYFKQYAFQGESKMLVSDVFMAHLEGDPKPLSAEIDELGWFTKAEALKLHFCVNRLERVKDFYRYRSA